MEIATKALPDGRVLVVEPTLFGARLCVAQAADPMYYEDVWCYPSAEAAAAAMAAWDGAGEPAGWHRHPTTGRRRPDGDPAREVVRE